VAQEDGVPYYQIEPSVMAFKIGRNPLQSEDRPWEYVPVRHVPVDSESFAYYGEDLLPNFDALPTWKYATPHNIQRNTPQTETCNSCHGNSEVFLTADDVLPEEQGANADVIVEEVPPAMP
jgi:thiosulfate/3-mercaptopyruvate sulfurtransferase